MCKQLSTVAGSEHKGVHRGTLAEPCSARAQIIHMAASALVAPEGENGDMTPASTMKGALEAMHSVDLSHPNIVQTYKSTQRPTQARAHRCLPSACREVPQ